jgi:hypothetical protein
MPPSRTPKTPQPSISCSCRLCEIFETKTQLFDATDPVEERLGHDLKRSTIAMRGRIEKKTKTLCQPTLSARSGVFIHMDLGHFQQVEDTEIVAMCQVV